MENWQEDLGKLMLHVDYLESALKESIAIQHGINTHLLSLLGSLGMKIDSHVKDIHANETKTVIVSPAIGKL